MLYLAGMVGFEPTNAGVKFQSLTAWLHPNIMSESTSYYPTLCDPVINGDSTIYTYFFTVTIMNFTQLDLTVWQESRDLNPN